MTKRSTKFYRKNEADVMRALGLQETKNSGAGWIEKEDGQNDYIIAQLKSTDAQSIRIHQKDLTILEYNAAVAHKVPCFVIQFIETNDVYVMAKPSDLTKVSKYLETGECTPTEVIVPIGTVHKDKNKNVPKVKSQPHSRNRFWEEKEKEAEAWKRNSKRR